MIRKRLEDQLKLMGPEALYERLQILDPEYAKTITQRDKHKIVRALEIITITRQKVSQIPKPNIGQNSLYNYRLWFVYLPASSMSSSIIF